MVTSYKILPALALSLFISLAAYGEDNATNYLTSGIKKGQGGDIPGAFADFSKAVELKPDYVEAYNERGLAAAAQAKGDNKLKYSTIAIADYSKAIDINPSFAPAYYNRGVAQQAQENWRNAKTDFGKVVDLKPDAALLAQAYLHLGQLTRREHDDDGAAHFFADAHYYHAVSFLKRGDTTNALAEFTKAIDYDATLSEAYYDRGKLRQASGDLDGALADFTKVVELDPKSARAYANLGMVKAKQGDAAGSNTAFNKAIELNPKIREVIETNGYSIK